MGLKTKARRRVKEQRRYLVARGAGCIVCTAHGWRAFKEPEERDCMSPCTLAPIYTVWARSKREAVEMVVTREKEKSHADHHND